MNTKRFLKSILTSSAIIAAASAPLYSASAAVVTANQNDAQLSLGGGGGHWGADTPADGDTVTFQAAQANRTVRADIDGSFIIDFNTNAGSIVEWGENTTTFSNFLQPAGAKDATLKARAVTQATTVTATGNINTQGIGTIDFNNQASTINLSPGDGNSADYSGVTFQSTGNNNGTVNIGNGTVTLGTFTAVGNAVKNITVADNAVAIASSDIVLAGGNGTLLADAAKLQINDGIKAGVVDGNAGPNRGTLEFLGASTVDAALGANNALKVIETKGAADKLVTATAAINTKKLVLGAGGMTTSEAVTVGIDGVTGTGKLAFTANKALNVSGDYASEGVIEVGAAGVGNEAELTYNAAVANKQVTSDFTAPNANSELHFTTGLGADSNLTIAGNVGTADNPFKVVKVTGGHDKMVLAADKTIFAQGLEFHDNAATLTLNEGSNIVGAIKANGGGNGALIIKGDSGSTSTTLNASGNRLGAITFDAAVSNKTFTAKAENGTTKLGTITFNAAAGDQSELLLDMASLAAGNNVNLDVTGVVAANAGSTGKITFKKGSNNATTQITVGAAHVGSAANKVSVIDATGTDLTITGGNNKLFANSVLADSVTLDQVAEFGVYSRPAGSPSKFIVKNNDSTIVEDSVIGDATIDFPDGVDRTLTLAKNVGSTGKITSTGDFGILALAEGNTLDVSEIGASGNSLTRIDLTHAGNSTYTINSDADVYADEIRITQNNDPTLVFNGNLKGSLRSTTDTKGIYKLQGNTTIDGSIDGATNTEAVGTVNIDTEGTITVGAVTANSHYEATNTIFDKDGTLKLSDKVTTIELGTVTTAGSSGTGTIEINADFDTGTNGDVGTTAKMLKEFRLGSDSTLTLQDAVHAKNITTTENNKGTVDFNVAGDHTGTSVGSSDKRMKQVTFTQADTVDDVYSKDITLNAAATAKRLDSTNAITGVGAVTLLDDGYISRNNGNGLVTTNGSAIIAGNLGGALTTAGASVDKVVEIRGDTVTGNVQGDASTIKLTKDTTFAGTLGTNGSTLDLNGKTLSVTGATTFNGDTVIKIGGSSDVTKASLRSDAGGATLAGGTLSLDLSGAANAGDTLKIFTKLDGTTAVAITGLNDGDAIALRNSKHVKSATYNGADNVVTLVKETDAKQIFGNSVMSAANSAEFARVFTKASADAGVTLSNNESAFFSEVLNSADPTEIVARQVPEHVGRVAEVNSAALGDAMNISNTRMSSTFASAPVGVAAGDAADRFGLWADVKAGTAEQKERKSEAGYKANTYGAFVGVDTMLSDNATLGMAFGYSNQNMKHKDSKSGDKTKAGTLTFGAYGNYDFGNSFFAQGNVAVGQTSVDAKERRGSAGNYTTAKAKYDVLGYSAEARGGYRYKFDNSTITPTAGLRLSYFGDSSYTETAAGAKNLVVKGKSRSVVSAVAGLNLATALDMDGVDVNPEVHMNLAYDLTAPKQKATYNFQGGNLKFDYKGAKPAKFAYNFGASVMAKADNVEYGVGYDANIADKYLGHTGSVKVKVSF